MESDSLVETAPPNTSRKWSRIIRVVGLFALLDGSFRLTDSLRAHASGWNQFELRDSLEIIAAFTWLAGGYATVLLKNWGRFLLMACYSVRMLGLAVSFWNVLSMASSSRDPHGGATIDTIGVLLGILVFGIPVIIVLTLWRGWSRVERLPSSRRSTKWRNIAATCLFAGAVASLAAHIDPGNEDVALRPGLDAACLRRAERRTFSRLGDSRGWRMSFKSKDGKIEIYPFPPGGSGFATFDPARGVLSVNGFAFEGEPYRAAPVMAGRKALHGVKFSREWGTISGQITFGEDDTGNLYLFLIRLDVYGKTYEDAYLSPISVQ